MRESAIEGTVRLIEDQHCRRGVGSVVVVLSCWQRDGRRSVFWERASSGGVARRQPEMEGQ